MNEISIKIKIAERTYPMKVNPEEESRIRNASKTINDRMTVYMNKFGIGDKQDLLAMVAFDCIIEKGRLEENQNKNVVDRLESILSLIDV